MTDLIDTPTNRRASPVRRVRKNADRRQMADRTKRHTASTQIRGAAKRWSTIELASHS